MLDFYWRKLYLLTHRIGGTVPLLLSIHSMKNNIPLIAVDAMGGDFAPEEIVKGIAAATHDHNARFILIGDSAQIKKILNNESHKSSAIKINHTGEYIGMDESPKNALEEKPNASIARAAALAAGDEVDAMLSAGNTGTLIMAAVMHIPMIEGVERSALAAVIPTRDFKTGTDGLTLLLDVGATIQCEVKHLIHFAFMGHVYARDILGITSPRIGLLNVGAEKIKGSFTLKRTHELLSTISLINFIGNREGNDILNNSADVVVCEGMTGNILIKFMEGAAESLKELGKHGAQMNLAYKLALGVLSPGLKKVKKRFDYAEYGGAPLLGFRHLCIKAHGKSKAKSVNNAVGVAIRAAKDNLCEKIQKSVSEFNALMPFEENFGPDL